MGGFTRLNARVGTEVYIIPPQISSTPPQFPPACARALHKLEHRIPGTSQASALFLEPGFECCGSNEAREAEPGVVVSKQISPVPYQRPTDRVH